MSTVVIQINDNKLPALKKFIHDAKASMRIIKDEEDIMQKLVEEGLKSKTFSVSALKRQLKKDAPSR